MLVKLQRPPPEIRIFLPMRSACSRMATRRSLLPASMAHMSPAAPAPRMRASKELIEELGKYGLDIVGMLLRLSAVAFCTGYAKMGISIDASLSVAPTFAVKSTEQ